jgi:energy-coupling factor transporter ATP-binding protein EcfA2
MKLRQIEFSELVGKPREWSLLPVQFEDINLLVGKNASGKTRILNIIAALAEYLSATRRELHETGSFKVTFESDRGQAVYELSIVNKAVRREKYSLNGDVLLDRGENGRGTIKAIQIKEEKLQFETPPTQLAAVFKRDAIQHPFLEELYLWATSVKQYRFGTKMGSDELFVDQAIAEDDAPAKVPEHLDYNKVFLIFRDGISRFNDQFKEAVAADMRALDYDIMDVGFGYLERGEYRGPINQPTYIYAKESDLKCETRQFEMSAGMFRALNLAIQLNYWAATKTAVCMLIDDIGEGLDFDRSTKLISLLIDKARNNNFQLIMTSNDRFVMNNVPLDYWGVVDRNGNQVQIVNHTNSPSLFERFKKIGLNNFDFFARGLYRNGAKK